MFRQTRIFRAPIASIFRAQFTTAKQPVMPGLQAFSLPSRSFGAPMSLVPRVQSISDKCFQILDSLLGGLMLIKRTFQPSLLRRKRKHGYLARANSRNGRKILMRRKAKGRKALCA